MRSRTVFASTVLTDSWSRSLALRRRSWVPPTGKTFYQADEESDNQRDRLARARIRFFAATGVLLKAGLVDRELVFGLIGPALDVDRRLLDIIITANRVKHRFPAMYAEVYYLDDEYSRWKQEQRI